MTVTYISEFNRAGDKYFLVADKDMKEISYTKCGNIDLNIIPSGSAIITNIQIRQIQRHKNTYIKMGYKIK